MKTLFLFDLDGVLLDSKENMRFAWEEVRRRLGISVPFEEYFAHIGRSFFEIMGLLGLTDRPQDIEAIFRYASTSNMASTPFFPGVEDALLSLARRGARLGVVTSKDKERTGMVLRRVPLLFATVRTPNPRYRGKPAPDHLLLAMAEARTDPSDTVYVGDMATDHEAAIRAGVDYAHASWGYGEPKSRCHVLGSLDELWSYYLRVA